MVRERGSMRYHKLTAGAAVMSAAAMAAGAVPTAGAATSAPSNVTVKESYSIKFVPNRYIRDGMRFDKDVYTIKAGGTVKFLMTAPQEGAHTFTVLPTKDIPNTVPKAFNCKPCNQLLKAHGADPNTETVRFQFLENGVGQKTAPNLDRPGDSAVLFAKKGSSVSFRVTAKSGATLHFMCLFHPWMQAEVKVK